MLSEDHDVAPRDRKSLLSRVRRRYGLLEGEQMTEDYIRHRPQDMEWIYISSESDTEMSDGDLREALTQRMQP